jgi:streptogramin lyase
MEKNGTANEDMLEKFRFAVLANNGCIYAVPSRGGSCILRIDTTTDTTRLMDYPYQFGSEKCVKAKDGKIYFADGEQVFQIDPSTDTVQAFGLPTDGQKLRVDILASNGKIYCISRDAFMAIDPESQTMEKLHAKKVTTYPGAGSAVSRPDGTILYNERYTSDLWIIDPTTNAFTFVKNPFSKPRNLESPFFDPNLRPLEIPNGRLYATSNSLSNNKERWMVEYNLDT